MPLSHKTIFSTLAPLAALALAASACGGTEAEAEATAGTYELFADPIGEPWCGSGDEAHVLDSDADLMGPHFAVSVMCRYTGTSVPENIAEQAEALRDLPQLADGDELLVNQVALKPNLTPEASNGESEAWVEAGGERLDLKVIPSSGGTVAVTVPSGEDAILWVEDEGRKQGLDFRTGERVDPVAGYYAGIDSADLTLDAFRYEDLSVLNSSKAYDITCAGGVEVSRNVWLVDQGWASEGSAFVTVELNWCSDFDEILRWELDQEASLAVVDGGDRLAPTSWNEREDPDGRIQVTALFEVPAEIAEFGLEFTPVGDLKSLSGGDDFAFADTPETTEWELAW